MSYSRRPVEILLVEDNHGDVELTRQVLKSCLVANNLHAVSDGLEASDFLRHRGKYGDASRVDLILLDLNLPRKDGRELLAEIKSDPALKLIPVIVLTTSASEWDILKCYSLHANCYVTKPLALEQYVTMVKTIEDFWLSTVKLPRADTL
ncbi:MAG: response regulator [Acidobacteria bacterium]|nr:response regulator [Acidobacteriota bacterium]